MKEASIATGISLERFLALLLLVLALALTAIYFKGRSIRGGYALNELQQENRRLASLKANLEAQMASINDPRFVLDQLQRFHLSVRGNRKGTPTASDLRLVQAVAGH